MTIAEHKGRLLSHADAAIARAGRDPAPLALKRAHTLRVLANAEKIAAAENFAPGLRRACILAALYHDLARFDQYLEYGTFKDAQSRNHGLWAVKLLKGKGWLQGEPGRQIILTAIALHNRRELPSGLRGHMLRICQAVRDADKLDILRIMDEHLARRPYNPTVVLSLPDDPSLCGQKVLACAMSRRPASYSDLRSVNDLRVLLGTWFFSLGFAASRRLFLAAGHGRNLVAALPEHGCHAAARAFLLACLEAA